MAGLAGFRAAVAASIAAAVPALATCEPYAGQFGAGEAKRRSFRAPAVFVAAADGSIAVDGTEELVTDLKLVAYVVAGNGGSSRERRAGDAEALMEAVALHVRHNSFGLEGVSPAKLERLDNLYSEALDSKGLALLSLTWRQQLRFGTSVWDGVGVTYVDVFAGYEPDVGAGHEEDYEQVVDDAA